MKNKMRILAVLGVFTIFLSFAFKPLNNKKTVVIDAGHGGTDFGAQIDGNLEKKIVENIAHKIRLLNGKGDVEIVLVRDGDKLIQLNERVNMINTINPSLLISLHINVSKNPNANGINAYVSKQNDFYEKSMESAKNLVEKLSNEKLAKGEVKDANFYITKNSKCPALILEVGYLSNDNDKNYITSEDGQNEIAKQIFEFINN
jgi:N-acetylmuramoyl-L-alanine amidase